LLFKGFSEKTEKGKTTYEVEMVVSGHTKDVELDPNGAILEIEEEVKMDSLAADVRAGLTAKAVGGKILKVESLTKKGKRVAYEAKVETGGRKSEIQVGRDVNRSTTKNENNFLKQGVGTSPTTAQGEP
jgi:hypothetical protein